MNCTSIVYIWCRYFLSVCLMRVIWCLFGRCNFARFCQCFRRPDGASADVCSAAGGGDLAYRANVYCSSYIELHHNIMFKHEDQMNAFLLRRSLRGFFQMQLIWLWYSISQWPLCETLCMLDLYLCAPFVCQHFSECYSHRASHGCLAPCCRAVLDMATGRMMCVKILEVV